MKKHILIFVIAALLAFSIAGCNTSGSLPSQEPTPTATVEPTPSPTPTEAPTPSPTETPAPTNNIAGVSSETGYVNDTLGFSMAYPEGFTVLTQDQINQLMAGAIEQIKGMFTDPDQAQQAINQYVPIAMAFKHPLTYADGFNANFNLIIYGLPAEAQILDLMTIVKAAIQGATSQAPSLQYGEPASLQIGGKDVVSADLTQTVNGISVTQRQYYFMCENYLVTITASAGNEDDLGELDAMVQSIEFAQ